MKSQTPEAWCGEGFFQIQSAICSANFQSNMLITQVRINERTIIWSVFLKTSKNLFSRMFPTMARETFQI